VSLEPDFLSVEDVLELHQIQLERSGGSAGIRDRGALESAVAQPQASFGGTFVHPDLSHPMSPSVTRLASASLVPARV
jgi:death-on-curing protein